MSTKGWFRVMFRAAAPRRLQVRDAPIAAPPFVFRGQAEYSPRLQNALRSLDCLVDWEKTDRVAGAHRIMRVDSTPAETILKALGEPQRRFRSVHITGSKGKGSVARLVLAGARNYVQKTGWYASPHVEKINERVGIASSPIQDDHLASALERALEAASSHSLRTTFFDILTAAAFDSMAAAGVTLAAVEVGMGGARDSTNVLPPGGISLLTNIHGTEHAEIIGPLPVDIAREKAGIAASQGAVLLTGIQSHGEIADEVRNVVESAGGLVKFIDADSSHTGTILESNSVLAEAALKEMEYRGWLGTQPKPEVYLDTDLITQTMNSFPGRMEKFKIGKDSTVLLDGAHTPDALQQLLKSVHGESNVTVVLALGKDKDAAGILSALQASEIVGRVICTQTGRESVYLPAAELYQAAQRIGLGDACDVVEDPIAAVKHGILVTPEGLCLVTGSLHLAGVVRPSIRALSTTAAR